MNELLHALAALIRQPVSREMCQECGGVFAAGTHVWLDIDGEEHPGCIGVNRGQAYLLGLKQFMGAEEEDTALKRARGYSVR